MIPEMEEKAQFLLVKTKQITALSTNSTQTQKFRTLLEEDQIFNSADNLND